MVVVFMVVVADTSAEEEASVAAVSEAVVVLARGTPALELGAAEVESASAECTPQVEFQTLLAQDPAFLHLGVHHIDNLSILDDLADP